MTTPQPLTTSRIRSTAPGHVPRKLTEDQRDTFRQAGARARAAKAAGGAPLHPVNVPALDPLTLMPQLAGNGLRALSLFSGGGGLDLGFDRAGFDHAASFEILPAAAETLAAARPDWDVHGGTTGDVTGVDWSSWAGRVDVVHGGPPCQPFSVGGRQQGEADTRDMWPAMIECIRAVRPRAFVAENVPALASAKFAGYVRTRIVDRLAPDYRVRMLRLSAPHFGVPQTRERVVFVGFADPADDRAFEPPRRTHTWGGVSDRHARCMGVREALGLPDIGTDALAPTIRSALTGPRHTTSILNSAAAARTFARLGIWPNGVAATRELAQAFPSPDGTFRLAVPDVALIQGFPQSWPFAGPTYMRLGQIGNAVPPPLAWAVATSVARALGVTT